LLGEEGVTTPIVKLLHTDIKKGKDVENVSTLRLANMEWGAGKGVGECEHFISTFEIIKAVTTRF